MWKKIGIKTGANTSQQQHSSLNNSPQATCRESRYRRRRPLDEKVLADRDLSSSRSRISDRSRQFGRITLESSLAFDNQGQPTRREDEEQLLPIHHYTSSPHVSKVLSSSIIRQAKLTEPLTALEKADESPIARKISSKPSVTFLELTDATQKEGDRGSLSARDLLRVVKRESAPQKNEAIDVQDNNDYIESLQNKLRDARKSNIRYSVKVAEIRKLYAEMKKNLKEELQAYHTYTKQFLQYAAKQIVNNVSEGKRLDQAVLRKVQNEREELNLKLKAEIQKTDTLKKKVQELQKKVQESESKLTKELDSRPPPKDLKSQSAQTDTPVVTENVTVEEIVPKEEIVIEKGQIATNTDSNEVGFVEVQTEEIVVQQIVEVPAKQEAKESKLRNMRMQQENLSHTVLPTFSEKVLTAIEDKVSYVDEPPKQSYSIPKVQEVRQETVQKTSQQKQKPTENMIVETTTQAIPEINQNPQNFVQSQKLNGELQPTIITQQHTNLEKTDTQELPQGKQIQFKKQSQILAEPNQTELVQTQVNTEGQSNQKAISSPKAQDRQNIAQIIHESTSTPQKTELKEYVPIGKQKISEVNNSKPQIQVSKQLQIFQYPETKVDLVQKQEQVQASAANEKNPELTIHVEVEDESRKHKQPQKESNNTETIQEDIVPQTSKETKAVNLLETQIKVFPKPIISTQQAEPKQPEQKTTKISQTSKQKQESKPLATVSTTIPVSSILKSQPKKLVISSRQPYEQQARDSAPQITTTPPPDQPQYKTPDPKPQPSVNPVTPTQPFELPSAESSRSKLLLTPESKKRLDMRRLSPQFEGPVISLQAYEQAHNEVESLKGSKENSRVNTPEKDRVDEVKQTVGAIVHPVLTTPEVKRTVEPAARIVPASSDRRVVETRTIREPIDLKPTVTVSTPQQSEVTRRIISSGQPITTRTVEVRQPTRIEPTSTLGYDPSIRYKPTTATTTVTTILPDRTIRTIQPREITRGPITSTTTGRVIGSSRYAVPSPSYTPTASTVTVNPVSSSGFVSSSVTRPMTATISAAEHEARLPTASIYTPSTYVSARPVTSTITRPATTTVINAPSVATSDRFGRTAQQQPSTVIETIPITNQQPPICGTRIITSAQRIIPTRTATSSSTPSSAERRPITRTTAEQPKVTPAQQPQSGNYEDSISTIMSAISKMRTSISDLSKCNQELEEKFQAPDRQKRTISRTTKVPSND